MCGRYYVDDAVDRAIAQLEDAAARRGSVRAVGGAEFSRDNRPVGAAECSGDIRAVSAAIHDRSFAAAAGGLGNAQQPLPETAQSRSGDVHPTELAPVLAASGAGLAVCYMRWGYPGFRKGQTVFNARAESVIEKRMFVNGVRHHRVVIPCTFFYEWNRDKEKFEFYRQDAPVLYMAGFADSFEDGPRYVILTTAANDSMRMTHDRMPLILEPDGIRDWIMDDRKTGAILGQVPVLLSRRSQYEQMTMNLQED